MRSAFVNAFEIAVISLVRWCGVSHYSCDKSHVAFQCFFVAKTSSRYSSKGQQCVLIKYGRDSKSLRANTHLSFFLHILTIASPLKQQKVNTSHDALCRQHIALRSIFFVCKKRLKSPQEATHQGM